MTKRPDIAWLPQRGVRHGSVSTESRERRRHGREPTPARKRQRVSHIDFAFFLLDNPAIAAIPLAFFLGWPGTVTDSRPADSARFARMQVRALTGVAAERGGRSLPVVGAPAA